MKDLKILVANEKESKEAQELFFELGVKWRGSESRSPIVSSLDYPFFVVSGYEGLYLTDSKILADIKEITLQELRGMVNQEIYKPSDFGASSLNDQYAEIEQVRQSGMKFDSNKPRHSLLPKGAVNSVIKVLEFGAKKYDADNWQKVDNAEERYYNAAMRHIDSWWNGEKCDPETGSHHLAHAATNLFFLMWFDNK